MHPRVPEQGLAEHDKRLETVFYQRSLPVAAVAAEVRHGCEKQPTARLMKSDLAYYRPKRFCDLRSSCKYRIAKLCHRNQTARFIALFLAAKRGQCGRQVQAEL